MLSIFKKKKNAQVKVLKAFISGHVIPISQVPDQVFSAKILGDGLAIEPEESVVIAPADGEVTAVMADSKHACGMKFENGVEVLIHVGLDTVDMNGKGFALHVKQGDKVKAGAPLISFSRERIKAAGHPDLVVFAVTDEAGVKNIAFRTGIRATAGQTIIVEF